MKRLTQRGMRGALFRYQFMANIVGVLIIPLFIFTGLHYAVGGFKIELAIFGVGHGYLYIVYLIAAGFLALKARLHIPWIILMFAAGLVPGLTFLVEWIIVTRKIQPLIAAQEAAAARPRPPESVQPLYDGAVRLAAALAHGLIAVPAAGRLQVVQQRAHQAHAAGAQRVPDGDGATTRVEARHVVGEFLLPHQGDGGEGLVALHGVELVDLHARTL